MGRLVGLSEGKLVLGLTEGTFEGLREGANADGAGVGTEDGILDGADVGKLVVGLREEGFTVGLEGFREGLLD